MVADVIDPDPVVPNPKRQPRQRHSTEIKDQAKALAQGGLSVTEIAKRIGVSRFTVNQWSNTQGWYNAPASSVAQVVTQEVNRLKQRATHYAQKQLEDLIPRLTAQAREAILVNSDAGPCIANQVKALASNKLSVDELESVSRTWERSMKVHRTTLGLDSDGVQLKLAVGIRVDFNAPAGPVECIDVECSNPTSTPLGQVDVEKV